jgi:hypothetical protein
MNLRNYKEMNSKKCKLLTENKSKAIRKISRKLRKIIKGNFLK